MGKQNLEKTEQKKFNFTPSVRREFEKFCERMSITEQDAAMAGCLWLAQSDPARMTQIMVNLHTFRQKAQAQSATPAEPVELADPAQTGVRWLIDGGWAYLAIGFCLLGWVLYLLKSS